MILNQYGQAASFISASKGGGYAQNTRKDFNELIKGGDQNRLYDYSRLLYNNVGVVRGAIDQKAMYTCGNSWQPRFLGEDTEYGKKATDMLLQWFDICDLRGSIHSFVNDLYLSSVQIDRDGDSFVLLTETKEGYPQIQMIPSYLINSEEDVVSKGRYKGRKITKGVIQSRQGTVIAYRVYGAGQAEYKDIPANNIVHIYEPVYCDQVRGIPMFSHAMNDFKSMSQSSDWELQAQMILSTIAFTESVDAGEEDLIGNSGNDGLESRAYQGGAVRTFRGSGKLETVKNERPGDVWQSFHDRLTRSALAGANWPLELVLEAQGRGTADRANIAKASRAVMDRQSLLEPAAKRIVTYALSKFYQQGKLESNPEFYRWGFSKPPRLSIDMGRDSQARIKEYQEGIISLSEIAEERGRTAEEVIRERLNDELLEIQLRKEYNLQQK